MREHAETTMPRPRPRRSCRRSRRENGCDAHTARIVSQGCCSSLGAEKPAHICKCSGVGGRCFERKTTPWNSPGDLHRCKRTARQSRHRSWDLNSTMALSCPLAAPMLVKGPLWGRLALQLYPEARFLGIPISGRDKERKKSFARGRRETRSSKFYTTIP